MGEFWTLEGIDGAGKSHLLARVAAQHSDAVVVRKDALAACGSAWLDDRLATMHRLTWSYDHAEPVWTYPSRYWLHTLAAWYELLHAAHIAHATAQDRTVVVDGWYFKHLARMKLPNDPHVASSADRVFSAVPQPDRAIWLPTPPEVAAHRRSSTSKPSEHGAFLTGEATTSPRSFTSYQYRTARLMEELLHEHSAPVHTLSVDDPKGALVNLLTEETRP